MRPDASPYTCRHYREEMMLLKMQHRLENDDLGPEERQALQETVTRLRQKMGMD
ncbi:MAG: hypothetical protein ACLFS7_00910 [Desulfosudaceae bacterium]